MLGPFFIPTKCNQDIENTSFWLPFNFCKARYVSFEHLCKDIHVKVLINTVLRAQILQDSSYVRQKDVIQRTALESKKKQVTEGTYLCVRMKVSWVTLPEICIRDVSLNKLVQRVVDDFLEVHCVLLLKHKSQSLCKGSYNKQLGRLTLNNQTQQLSPMYQIWGPVEMLQKHCLRKLGCESFAAASSAATVRLLSSDTIFFARPAACNQFTDFQINFNQHRQ